MRIPKATVRFAAVVKQCGRPEPVTLWLNPRQDKAFQKAVDENRVLTIKQETVGNRKDFGVVGFHRDRNVSYWLFAKPLDEFEGKRVIGIDYGLVNVRAAKSAGIIRESSANRRAKPSPAPRERFRVVIRCQAVVELSQELDAKTRREAKEQALAAVAHRKVDFSRATQTRRVVRITRLPPGGLGTAGPIKRFRQLPDQPEPPNSNSR